MDSRLTPPPPPVWNSAELLQAQAELWCHTYGYLKSMALHSAIKLGIANAVSRCGGAASLSELHAVLPIARSKRPCLSRLMRFLAATGIFKEEEEEDARTDAPAASQHTAAGGGVDRCRYRLTAVSRLLVDDDEDGSTCLAPFVACSIVPSYFMASLRVADWLQTENDGDGDDEDTPLTMAVGTDVWGLIVRDAEFGRLFNEGMGSDSRFVARIVVRECREVFQGLESLVDVGGGDGTMAKAIAEAFPRVGCKVLELPEIVDGFIMPAAAAADGCGKVEFVAGDMMEFIPTADALLLKFILHDWSDDKCARILKRCKEAVTTREPKGKVLIIDAVVGLASNRAMLEAQLLIDLSMMTLVTGKERGEQQWSKLFMDAGFTRYKINPILGCHSLIEVYP